MTHIQGNGSARIFYPIEFLGAGGLSDFSRNPQVHIISCLAMPAGRVDSARRLAVAIEGMTLTYQKLPITECRT